MRPSLMGYVLLMIGRVVGYLDLSCSEVVAVGIMVIPTSLSLKEEMQRINYLWAFRASVYALCIPSSFPNPYFCAAPVFAIITPLMLLTPSSLRGWRFTTIKSMIAKYLGTTESPVHLHTLLHQPSLAKLLLNWVRYVATHIFYPGIGYNSIVGEMLLHWYDIRQIHLEKTALYISNCSL